jgi:hypothetical protein
MHADGEWVMHSRSHELGQWKSKLGQIGTQL